MDSNHYEPFLSMVRLGIGHDAKPLPKYVDWNFIKKLADDQGLTAVILDGIDEIRSCKSDVKCELPSQDLMLEWIGEVLQDYEGRYSDYKKAIGSLAKFYNRHGIKMMVLKGYACSLDWPKPAHRPCGDIDTWNYGKQQEADKILSLETGIKADKSKHHHTVFWWMNNMVENHYDFLNVRASKSNAEIELILKELAKADGNLCEVNGAVIYLPSTNLNALFLLRHSLNHFASVGISLRHLLDWAFFWEKNGKKVNWEWLKGLLQKHSMMDFFHIVNSICVEDLGFDKNVFPETQSSKSDLKARVLKDILDPETEKRDAHKQQLIPRLVFKIHRRRLNSWKRQLCYNENNWSSLWTSVWGHLVKPQSI